jgi:hypothetical protein
MMQVLLGGSDVAGWGAFLKVGILSLALKKACAVFLLALASTIRIQWASMSILENTQAS